MPVVKAGLTGAATAILALAAGAANAGNFRFTFVGPTYHIAGTFLASDMVNPDGTFDITSAAGMMTSSDPTLHQGAFTLYPGHTLTADGTATFSNTYLPAGGLFGGQGVEFLGSNFELNIYNGIVGNGPSCPGNCAAVPFTGHSHLYDPGDVGTLTIQSVPEPATWGLMLSGFGLAGAALRRRRSIAAAA